MSMSICFGQQTTQQTAHSSVSSLILSIYWKTKKHTPLKINMVHLKISPNKKDIPNLETIIFSFHSFNFGAINLSESCPSAGGSGPFHGAKPAEFQWNSIGIPWTKLNGQKWNNISTNMIFFYIEGCSLEIWWYMTIYDDNNVKMNGILV